MTVDLGAVEHGAVATHPKLLGIRVPLQRPLENGLSEDNERPGLESLAQRLEAEVVAAADGLFVFRYVASGFLHLHFYVPKGPRRRPNLTDGYDPYKPELVIHDDPEWTLLQEFAPDDWQQELIATGRILVELEALGDEPAAKRKVDHTILIPPGVDPTELIERLQHSGYTVEDVNAYDTETSINCSRVDDLTDQIARVREVFNLAHQHGGTYDGWGAPITKL